METFRIYVSRCDRHRIAIVDALEMYRDRPIAADDDLIASALETRRHLGDNLSVGPYRRFGCHLDRLCAVLMDSQAGPEPVAWARAGLSYLLAPDQRGPLSSSGGDRGIAGRVAVRGYGQRSRDTF